MLAGVILTISLLLQIVALVLAVRLVRITGWRTPWLLIAGAILLMAVRRGISLRETFLGSLPGQSDPSAEVVGLAVSVFMVLGLSRIAPYFLSAKLAEQRGQEHEHFLQRVLDTEPGTVYIYDLAEQRNVFTNRHWLTAYGYSREETEAMGSDLLARIVHPDDLAGIAAHHAAWGRSGGQEIHEIECRVRTKENEWRWLRSREAPFACDDSGRVKQILGIAHDITERRRTGDALRESQRFLSGVMANMPGMVYRCRNDEKWTMEFVSDGCAELTGYPAADLVGNVHMSFGSLVYPDDRGWLWEACQRSLDAKAPCNNEYRIMTANGGVKWIWDQAHGIYSDDGELLAVEGFVTDISERKRSEEAVRDRERQLSSIADNIPGLVSRVDLDLRYLFVNSQYERTFGVPSASFVGRRIPDVVGAEAFARFEPYIKRALAGERVSFESWIKTASGELFHGQATYVPDIGSDGMVQGLFTLVTDISERKRAEEQLRAKEAHLQTLVANVPGAVYRCGYAPNWTVEFISEPIQAISGYPASDFIGDSVRSYGSIIEPDDWPEVERITKECLGRSRPYEVEYRIRHADGSQRWVHDKGQGVFDVNGELRWLDGVVLDISKRKRAEEEANQLITLIENSDDFIGVADLQGKVVYLNNAGRALVGVESPEVAATMITDYIAQEDQALLHDVALRQIFQEGHWHGELRFRHFKTGQAIYQDCSGFLIRDATGKPQSIATVSRDLSERKRVEDALREHDRRLQMLSQRLVQVQEEESRRIGRELHDDLGQILTTLKIKLQALRGPKDGWSFEEQVADLTRTADQAVGQVRTISANLRPAMLDDLGLVAALRWMLDRQAQQAGLKGVFVAGIETRLLPELETTCFRVVQEALTNVVRHARAKLVRLEVHHREQGLHLQVWDDGVGFDSGKALADISLGKNLGLLGMQERVALVDGRLTIRSTLGRGTDVQAWFPLGVRNTAETPTMQNLPR